MNEGVKHLHWLSRWDYENNSKYFWTVLVASDTERKNSPCLSKKQFFFYDSLSSTLFSLHARLPWMGCEFDFFNPYLINFTNIHNVLFHNNDSNVIGFY